MKGGLNELDLRKPISVEKHKTIPSNQESSESSIDIIQHQKSTDEDEEPELIRDKNVKIIKHTKNEVLEKFTGSVHAKDDEEIEEDSDFERMSNDDLNTDDPLVTKKVLPNNYMSVDKDGVKWTHLYANDDSTWHSFKKFDRWMIIDGLRHTHEEHYSEPLQQTKGPVISARLELIMSRILNNLSLRYSKPTKAHK